MGEIHSSVNNRHMEERERGINIFIYIGRERDRGEVKEKEYDEGRKSRDDSD